MKANEERMKAYRELASASPDSMESCIRRHLEENCLKFKGNEDKLERCIEYVTECAREILDGKNGDVADSACYAMARDYFDDEIWKAEDEEEAVQKAEREKREAERKNRKAEHKKKAPKSGQPATATCSAADAEPSAGKSGDVPVQVILPKVKPFDGQLDLFAALGV